MTIQLLRAINNYIGLSSDSKPTTDIEIGSTFTETDTGTEYMHDGSSWFARTAMNPMLDVAMGLRTNMSVVNKFGSNPSIDDAATWEIWDGARVYVWPTTASITHIRAAADSAITQGVTLEVQGLDTNWDLVTQTKATDAADSTTEVALDTALRRIFRVKVLDDTTMDQDIWVGPNPATAANSSAIIQTGNNQTLMALYTVPNGKTAFITHYYYDYFRDSVKDPDGISFSLWHRDNTNGYAPQLKHQKGIPKQAPGGHHMFMPYMKVLEKTDIFMTASPDGAAAHTHAGFDIILVDN